MNVTQLIESGALNITDVDDIEIDVEMEPAKKTIIAIEDVFDGAGEVAFITPTLVDEFIVYISLPWTDELEQMYISGDEEIEGAVVYKK